VPEFIKTNTSTGFSTSSKVVSDGGKKEKMRERERERENV
jgi:hypothetical protein